jgi:hypothetical protein
MISPGSRCDAPLSCTPRAAYAAAVRPVDIAVTFFAHNWAMKQGKVLVLGVVLFIAGVFGCLYFALQIEGARLHGIFSSIRTDSPSQSFQTFQCPYFVDQGETASVRVTIQNSSPDPLDYSVQIAADGFRIGAAVREQEITVPSQQIVDVNWTVTALDSGQQVIVVEAVSSKDAALPETFHMWPTSYREGCGILVLAGPVKGWQLLGLGLGSVVVGSVLAISWIYEKIRARRFLAKAT